MRGPETHVLGTAGAQASRWAAPEGKQPGLHGEVAHEMPLERQVRYSGRRSRERATLKCQAILQPLQIFLQPNMKVRGFLNLRSIHSGSSCIITWQPAAQTCVRTLFSLLSETVCQRVCTVCPLCTDAVIGIWGRKERGKQAETQIL